MSTSVHVCVHARVRVSNPCARIYLTWVGGVRVLRRATHSPWLLELREFSFKPATLMLGHPPLPASNRRR